MKKLFLFLLLSMLTLNFTTAAEVDSGDSGDDDSSTHPDSLATGESRTNTSKDTPCALSRSFNPKLEMQDAEQGTEGKSDSATGRI